MSGAERRIGRARTSGLLSEELGDELVIFDTESKKAHHLDRVSTAVWKRCDGLASKAAVAHAITTELDEHVTEESVEAAEVTLQELGLLDLPSTADAGISRRALIKKAALVAAAVPVITTLTAPPAAAQTSIQTCINPGKPRTGTCLSNKDCCMNSCIQNPVGTGKICAG